jgi:hypothetical protein
MMIYGSARERNHSRLIHSSRNLPLKLSVTPFYQGLSRSINAVPMLLRDDPRQQSFGYKLWSIIAAQEPRGAACADQAG